MRRCPASAPLSCTRVIMKPRHPSIFLSTDHARYATSPLHQAPAFVMCFIALPRLDHHPQRMSARLRARLSPRHSGAVRLSVMEMPPHPDDNHHGAAIAIPLERTAETQTPYTQSN